ncbi:hypothetical protein PDESU_04813 [Pontiella desulfatans]|uniref:alpha-L-fucosidase n=1 Tax=Pontiella desulfatans TaxID=2750659 RepID=A0A6C2U7Y8_PONDE|nr:alpha-L-fucosidase [Pontiella desulfatans]VGO16222.1 hypothetical protein PDESU_04813 [Pontiella desulfatans]
MSAEQVMSNPTGSDSYANKTNVERDAGVEWWRDARFGMFIHWGVYAVPAGEYGGKVFTGASEWLMHQAKIPASEYRHFAEAFNPVAYDPETWVRAAVDAGMKYLVITAKHHDGFALFPSKASTWNVAEATPYGRDLLGPLVDACRRAGLRIGFYYSQAQDWFNGGSVFGEKWDPVQENDFDAYLDRVAIPQIRELLTTYGPDIPAVLWWDTPSDMTPDRAARVDAAVQAVAPGMLQNDRLGLIREQHPGHFDTPEQRIPANRPGRAWETCMTTNESWGFCASDNAWKPAALLIRQLCEVVSQGGNYLLNIGPRADGTFPEPSLAALREVGDWMRVNGEAVHGTSAGPFPYRLPWGFASRRDRMMYLMIDEWPVGGLLEVPLLDLPETAQLLSDPEAPVGFRIVDNVLRITLPASAPGAAVCVVALRFAAEPRIGNIPSRPRPPVIPQPADGSLALRAADAEIIGDHLSLLGGEDPFLGCWSSVDSHPLWRVSLHRAGTYRVEVIYAVPAHREGTVAEIRIGGQSLPFAATGTGGWGEFCRAPAGVVSLEPGEEVEMRVIPACVPVGAVMNLRAVLLTPCASNECKEEI